MGLVFVFLIYQAGFKLASGSRVFPVIIGSYLTNAFFLSPG